MNLRRVLKLINLLEHKVKTIVSDRLREEPEFGEHLKNLYLFFGKKLIATCKNEHSKEIVYKYIKDLVNVQFLHGYHLVYELKNTEQNLFEPFENSAPGILKNQLRMLIDKLFLTEDGEKVLWERNETTEKITRLFIREIPDCFETLEKILYEIAIEGVYSCILLNSTYKDTNEIMSIIGDPLDAHFLTPENYALLRHFDERITIIDLYKVGDKNEEDYWCGSCEFFDLGENKNILISIDTIIRSQEYIEVCNSLLRMIPSTITTEAKIRTQRVEAVTYYNFSSES